jgi:hypothetical protein
MRDAFPSHFTRYLNIIRAWPLAFKVTLLLGSGKKGNSEFPPDSQA